MHLKNIVDTVTAVVAAAAAGEGRVITLIGMRALEGWYFYLLVIFGSDFVS